jgi:hypothetical protein
MKYGKAKEMVEGDIQVVELERSMEYVADQPGGDDGTE